MADSGIGGVLLHQREYGKFFFVLEVNEVDRKASKTDQNFLTRLMVIAYSGC